MQYTIKAFAELTGVSERTLRFYHQKGLLHPTIGDNGYRYFGSEDADTIQLIRFYTATGLSLAQVSTLLKQPVPTRIAALRQQRAALLAQQQQLTTLIAQIDCTITNQEDNTMSDSEKFSAFKHEALAQNDAKYGEEVVAKWGQEAKAKQDQHFAGLSEAAYQHSQAIRQQLANALREAIATAADPAGELGAQVTDLHRQWLTIMRGHYDTDMHLGHAEMYEADQRFSDYYDQLAGAGASTFLIQTVRAQLTDQ